MLPLLPQNDPTLPARRIALERARTEYIYDRSTSDLVFAESVPKRDQGGARYWAELVKVNLDVSVNKARIARPDEVAAGVHVKLAALAAKIRPGHVDEAKAELFSQAGKLDTQYPAEKAEDFDRAYAHLPEPAGKARWDDDDFLAWVALAGSNPTLIQRLDTVPEKLLLTAQAYERVMPADTLQRALQQGRVFVADYKDLAGASQGQVDEYAKYVMAPIAVYAAFEGAWRLVGIQTCQDPSDAQFVQPGQGQTWRMAKVALTAADSQLTGLVAHFGLCHVVMEAVTLASKRNLASNHPLRLLLEAHTENTLIVNEITRKSLTPVGGAIDRMMGQTLEDSLALTARTVRAFRLMDSAPHEDFLRRGVSDRAALPDYPYRDDQLLLWEALSPWIDAYVRLYYPTDSDVFHDEELQSFVAELEHEHLGGLAGIGHIESVDRLVHLMTRIVFRASAFHAAINYALYDFGYAPLQPQAQFAAGPTGEDSEADFLAMLPPFDVAYEVIEAFHPLSVRINRLGQYAEAFIDSRVAPLVEALQAQLGSVESEIERRNRTRFAPYPYCLPSRVSNSIHV